MSVFSNRLAVLKWLEDQGVIKERMPEHDGHGGSIWSWDVLQPDRLPNLPWLRANRVTNHGLIRL